MIEKFTFDIVAPRVKKKLILVKNENEHREHVVLKLLTYILLYDPRLKIEADIGMHYKPDLVIEGEHGVPEVWVDCGQIALEKAEKLSRKLRNTRLVFVKETQSEMGRFKATVDKKVEHANRIEYLAFDDGFVENIAAHLGRSNELTLYEVDENTIGMAFGGEVFESHLFRIARSDSKGKI